MHNFPVPYPDELIYSLVARAGIRSAIVSSKQLLDDVFGDRKVIATIDLPSHLVAISSQLIGTGRFDVQQLIYDHTMFPVYAPFIDESIRVRAMGRMANCSKGAVHLCLALLPPLLKRQIYSVFVRYVLQSKRKNMEKAIGLGCGTFHPYSTAPNMGH